jgi:RimJ/RimL family protein N-acetyltransferase
VSRVPAENRSPSAAPHHDHGAMDVPELSDGVVTLRAHTPSDVDELVAMATDLDTVRWTSIRAPYDHRHAQRWVHDEVPAGWRDGSGFRWAVEAADGATPRFAGNVDIRTGPPPDIGFAAAPWARSRGLTARAVRLATRWGFEQAHLPVVHWTAHAGNLASWRVAHACGFTFHGERPLSVPQRGTLHDGWFATLRPGDEPTARTTWWPTPVLHGARVRLRPHTAADVPRIVEACSDERTRLWLTSMPDPYTAESAESFVRGCRLAESLGQQVTWVVADRDDDRLLANIGIFRLADERNPTSAEIGYWAHPDARGRGVVSAAVELVLDHAFTPREEGGLGRHRVQIAASWTNTASRHVAERAGCTLVGHFREDGPVGSGEQDDGAWYDLPAREWRSTPRR